MSNVTIETDKPAANAQLETETEQKKPAKGAKPVAEHSNKKAEVIVLMKRSKGATLAEIMELTAWQKHSIRGFVSILGKKGEHNVESVKNAAGERTPQDREVAQLIGTSRKYAAWPSPAGRLFNVSRRFLRFTTCTSP